MKRELAALILATALSGCASDAEIPPSSPVAAATTAPATNPSPGDEIVATVRGNEITMRELQAPLIEAYGLNMMLELVQLDLAAQEAQRQNVTVSQQEMDDETMRTLIAFRKASKQDLAQSPDLTTEPSEDSMTPMERNQLLGQLLSSQHLTEVEFGLAMKTNAILRKLVAPSAEAAMTDENIRNHFNAIYGEKAHVKFIRLPDMLSVATVEQELKSGRTFDAEERLHAYDSFGRPSSGDLPPFSRQDPYYQTEFKMVAFGLKPGQVSDPVQIKDDIYLLQLQELIPPQHANYEDYKDAVRRDLYDQEVQARVKFYLQNIRAAARQSLEIKNPVLRRQWDQNLRNADELRQQLQKQAKEKSATAPGATGPAASTAPAN